jgi:predicted phosphatase
MQHAKNQYLTKTPKVSEMIKANYQDSFIIKAKQLATKRRKYGVTVSEMSKFCGVSIRKLQSFEAGHCFDYYLIYAYTQKFADMGMVD